MAGNTSPKHQNFHTDSPGEFVVWQADITFDVRGIPSTSQQWACCDTWQDALVQELWRSYICCSWWLSDATTKQRPVS